MPKRSLSDQLNEAVETIMAHPDAAFPSVDPRVTGLLQIAAELRDLPSEEFRARLKADLQRIGSGTGDVKAVPAGHFSATPCLVVRDAPGAIEFYKRAFGATELMRLADPGGNVVHAEIKIGDSPIAIAPEEWGNLSPQSLGGSPVIVQLYVEDVDAFATQAVAAGAEEVFPIADQFYGDRAGRLADPFGHLWIIATHKEDVTVEEMQRRAEVWMRDQAPATEPIAAGSYRIEPYLSVRGAEGLIDFLKEAFGAEETSRHTRPDGVIAHAEVRIGDSVIGAGDATGVTGPAPTALHLYVPDADTAYQRALRAGAISMHEPVDQDYGDREASVKDLFGNHWYIATHKGGAHILEGLHSVTSYLHPHGAPQLIDFLKRAFGAQEAFRAESSDGTIVHAKIRIGESVVEMGEAHGPYQPMPAVYHLYVNDTDAVYRRALEAGAVSVSEPADQPWGYRNAGVQDPGGNQWWINARLKKREPMDESTAPSTLSALEPATSFPAVTPFLQVRDVGQTVNFLKEAFGAEVIVFDRGGEPPHDHADLRIGDSMLMMGEAIAGHSPTTSAFYLHVADVDAAYGRALRAGAASQQPPRDMPWGHRMAHVKDPLDNSWFIAARKKEGRPEQPAKPATETGGHRHGTMPFLYIRDAAAALEFYKKVLGATELMRQVEPSGVVSHVQIRAGDAQIMIRDPSVGLPTEYIEKGLSRTARELGGTPVHLYLYVDDVDAVFNRALAAGATVVDALGDKEWGDRCGGFQDPFGHIWYVATPIGDVPKPGG
jgi:PhnB protein